MLQALVDAQRPGAPGQQVHPAVLHPLEHPLDYAGTPHLPQAVVRQPHDPELLLLLQALVHHRLVALLEDVQRNELAGKRHDRERKQREVANELIRHRHRSLGLRLTRRQEQVVEDRRR